MGLAGFKVVLRENFGTFGLYAERVAIRHWNDLMMREWIYIGGMRDNTVIRTQDWDNLDRDGEQFITCLPGVGI